MRKIMTRAWEIARNAVEKFGGKVKEYFAQALKMAWKEVRKPELKKWFERKLANEMGIVYGNLYSLELFCKIKETEKAAYCMMYIGHNSSGICARKKCAWIPKSVIKNYNSLKEISDYEKAAYSFSFAYN